MELNLSKVQIPSGYPSCRSSKSAVSILCGFLKRDSAAQSAYSAHPACITMGLREGSREGEGKRKREKGKKGKRGKGGWGREEGATAFGVSAADMFITSTLALFAASLSTPSSPAPCK